MTFFFIIEFWLKPSALGPLEPTESVQFRESSRLGLLFSSEDKSNKMIFEVLFEVVMGYPLFDLIGWLMIHAIA